MVRGCRTGSVPVQAMGDNGLGEDWLSAVCESEPGISGLLFTDTQVHTHTQTHTQAQTHAHFCTHTTACTH